MNFLSLSLLDSDKLSLFQRKLVQDDLEWLDGKLTAGEQAAVVKHNRQLNPESDLACQLSSVVTTQLCSTPLVKSFSLIRRVHSVLVSRCNHGDGYGWHVDNPFSKHGRRDISFTVFLSNLDDYEGGGLEIQGVQDTSLFRLPAGHVVMYPSSSLHRVQPVSRGTRYACVGWIESYVQADEDRSLLFNLDAGARGLLARYGRSDELDLIFQSYTNAVRRLSR